MTSPPLPWLTNDCPGVGGVIKRVFEDFQVEEVPAYQPTGKGDHLFLWIEKRDISAEYLLRHLARTLEISRLEIGMAGMKDRRAVTRQFVSIPAWAEAKLPQVETDDLHILSATRHGHKLKTGHLRGNHFSIVVRDVLPDAYSHALKIAERVKAIGFPNYFGDQRFGHERSNWETGMALLRGEKSDRSIPKPRRKFLLRLSLSAVQSELFNQCLAHRLESDLFETVLLGDVMQVTASGGVFVVEDPEKEQPRFATGEIVATGPLFGPKMRLPQGEVAEQEARVLQKSSLTRDHFLKFRKHTPGGRRPYLIHPQDLEITQEENHLRFTFTLPSGVYATTLLREFRAPLQTASESTSVD